MITVLYNIFLMLFKAGMNIASLFNPKAKRWLQGRKNIFENLQTAIPKNEKVIWMHCASLGEFEQGRPVIERLKAQGSAHKVLLTFFSPSGYEVQKNYKGADWVFYLPVDGAGHAKKFLDIVNPSLAIFVKYDYWFYYLQKVKERKIPLILISALFQKHSVFFKWYGVVQRKMLSTFDHLFVQNEESKELLGKIGYGNKCTVSGDTRFDRVIEIAEKFEPVLLIEQFIDRKKCIVAGSTWKDDEDILSNFSFEKTGLKLIIAPHEVAQQHLSDLKKNFPDAVKFSEWDNGRHQTSNVLIIDRVGILSRLYKYAYTAYLGGGFTKSGVHNVLEAAVYGKPVLLGPNYKKFREVKDLVASGGAIVINNAGELNERVAYLMNNENEYEMRCGVSKNYVQKNRGATDKILRYVQENRLLMS